MKSRILEPHNCDLCGTLPEDYIIDGRTVVTSPGRGSWAWLCPSCWSKHGIGKLGPGFGQRFDQKTHEKVEG
jgi:hypothetical protein